MNQDPIENTAYFEELLALAAMRAGSVKSADFQAVCQAKPLKSLVESADTGDPSWADWLICGEKRDSLEAELASWKEQGLRLLAITHPDYPDNLRMIHEPPIGLFVKGQWRAALTVSSFAIVGSRRADLPSLDLAAQFAEELAECGVCIVSGLALGVDAAAHSGALRSAHSFPTVAVMGSGLDAIYPRSNEKLAAQILERGGALVSQFEPGMKPYPQNFLNRNRVIAGISRAVVVVSAGKRSGSLSTARHAMEEGREVYVVPGFPKNTLFFGSNKLIQSGAALVTGVDDIAQDFPQLRRSREDGSSRTVPLTALTEGARDLLGNIGRRDSISVEELVLSSKDARAIPTQLLELELAGHIRRLPGSRIALR